MKQVDLVVTRHDALVKYLMEKGYITPDTIIKKHVKGEDVRDKHVIGNLPLSLAVLTKSITEVPLELDESQRGRELTLEEIRECACEPVTYNVLWEDYDNIGL